MSTKSLLLCRTLCDPMDCSPPGSSVSEILQARILEWVAISFSMDRATDAQSWKRQTYLCAPRSISSDEKSRHPVFSLSPVRRFQTHWWHLHFFLFGSDTDCWLLIFWFFSLSYSHGNYFRHGCVRIDLIKGNPWIHRSKSQRVFHTAVGPSTTPIWA